MEQLIWYSDQFIPDLLRSTIALLIVIDPIGIVPVFIALTRDKGKQERKEITKTAVVTAALMLTVFAIAGTQILSIFGVSIASFMVAGGVLLFIVAIELLTHGEWRFGNDRSGGESGIVPIAFPLLAGPGAITAVIISYETSGVLVSVISIAIVIGITTLILNFVDAIYRVLGRRGSVIVTRVFVVFIAAIAVQYIVEGAKSLFS